LCGHFYLLESSRGPFDKAWPEGATFSGLDTVATSSGNCERRDPISSL
jgi:hypothetical protein